MMKIKILKHQVRDNLYVVSEDLQEVLERGLEPSDYIHEHLFNNLVVDITVDKMLPNGTGSCIFR